MPSWIQVDYYFISSQSNTNLEPNFLHYPKPYTIYSIYSPSSLVELLALLPQTLKKEKLPLPSNLPPFSLLTKFSDVDTHLVEFSLASEIPAISDPENLLKSAEIRLLSQIQGQKSSCSSTRGAGHKPMSPTARFCSGTVLTGLILPILCPIGETMKRKQLVVAVNLMYRGHELHGHWGLV